MRDTGALGSFWDYLAQYGRKPPEMRRPRVSATAASGRGIPKALVQVQCMARPYGATNLSFPHSSLRGIGAEMYDEVEWPVPEAFHTWQSDPAYSLTFNFTSMNGYANAATIGALFYITEAESHQAMIVPCSVLAHYVPAKLWIDPRTDLNIHDDTENPLDLFQSHVDKAEWRQISLSEAWLAMLHPSDIEDVLEGMTGSDGEELKAGFEGVSWRLSTLLGLWLTDAIARAYPMASFIVHHGPEPRDEQGYRNSILEVGRLAVPSGYKNWTTYVQDHESSMLAITIDRFGYGWSLNGVLIKLSLTVLLAHVLLALGHVFILQKSRLTSTAFASMGTIVALALRSNGAKKTDLSNIGAGVGRSQTWANAVGVYADNDDHLELVLGSPREGGGRKAEPGRLYA